jgi:hypothetical protein
MAHWALLDKANIVIDVVTMDNDHKDGQEGYLWLQENRPGKWVRTSYNTVSGKHILGGTPFRKNYASIGCFYDEVRDAFITPHPNIPSWIIDEETGHWVAPVPRPADEGIKFGYRWNETTKTWDIDHIVPWYEGELTDEERRLYHRPQ